MFSNLCVYGRCVNIFGMFRCECDEGYALDGSGGKFMNGLELLKYLRTIFRCMNLSLLCFGRSYFYDIVHILMCVHRCTQTYVYTHAHTHSSHSRTFTDKYCRNCNYHVILSWEMLGGPGLICRIIHFFFFHTKEHYC